MLKDTPMDDHIEWFPTNICTECGQEYERGLMSWMRHVDDCKHNAPNESIDSHIRQVEWDRRMSVLGARDEEVWGVVWPHLTEDERNR